MSSILVQESNVVTLSLRLAASTLRPQKLFEIKPKAMTIMGALHAKLSETLNSLSLFEFLVSVLLFVLMCITIFRKRLSSNDEYRRGPETEKQAYCKKNPVVRPIDENKEKIAFNRLSSEVTINIVSYLNNQDISCLMSTSKKLYTELSIDCIWEQLWLQTYGSMWQHPEIRKIREGRGIFWDPMLNYGPPQQGWYRFFLLFEVSWLDWILAGYCNHSRCLVGINNSVVDVTNFISQHPGSPETLTEASGCEATELFQEIGHSSQAENLLASMAVWNASTSNVSTCLCANIHLQQNLCGHCIQAARNERNPKYPIVLHQMRNFPARSKLHEHMKDNKKKVAELAYRKHQEAAANASAANNPHELHFDTFAAVIPLLDAVHSGTNSVVSAVHSGTSSVISTVQTSTNNAILNNALMNNTILNGITEEEEDNDSADTESEYSHSLYSDSNDTIEDPDGIPEVPGISVIFSPSKSLSSILDKMGRSYRRAGSIQRSLRPRIPSVHVTGELEDVSDTDAEDEAPPPLDSYFGPCTLMVPELGGFDVCLQPQDHLGQPKAFFDPFTEEWTVWWSCCGQGQVLVEAPVQPGPVEHAADVIFCK